MQSLRDCAAWLLKSPRLHDLWTYCGTWILTAIATRQSHALIFSSVLPDTLAWMSADIFGIASTSVLLKVAYACSWRRALIISVGAICVGVMIWPYFHLDLSNEVRTGIMLFGLVLSSPLSCCTVEESSSE